MIVLTDRIFKSLYVFPRLSTPHCHHRCCCLLLTVVDHNLYLFFVNCEHNMSECCVYVDLWMKKEMCWEKKCDNKSRSNKDYINFRKSISFKSIWVRLMWVWRWQYIKVFECFCLQTFVNHWNKVTLCCPGPIILSWCSLQLTFDFIREIFSELNCWIGIAIADVQVAGCFECNCSL